MPPIVIGKSTFEMEKQRISRTIDHSVWQTNWLAGEYLAQPESGHPDPAGRPSLSKPCVFSC